MKEPKILIFAIEGMNRAGKSTQIGRLKKYLEKERGILTFAFRAEGRRTGVDEDNHFNVDPTLGIGSEISKWDKFKLAMKFNKSTNYQKVWKDAVKQLEDEFLYFKYNILPKILEEKGDEFAVIIFDRGLVSRYFREKQHEPRKKFTKTLNESHMKADHYFVLDVSLKELLRRSEEDKSEKAEFRKKMIVENFSFFAPTVNSAFEILPKNQISLINGERDKNKVELQIRNIVDEYIRKVL